MNILVKLLQGLKSRSSANRKAREDIQRVLALPFEQVKQHALDLIADTRRFRGVTENLSNNPEIEKLGPVLRDFVFVYRVEGVVKSRDFHKTVDKSREFGYLKLDE